MARKNILIWGEKIVSPRSDLQSRLCNLSSSWWQNGMQQSAPNPYDRICQSQWYSVISINNWQTMPISPWSSIMTDCEHHYPEFLAHMTTSLSLQILTKVNKPEEIISRSPKISSSLQHSPASSVWRLQWSEIVHLNIIILWWLRCIFHHFAEAASI